MSDYLLIHGGAHSAWCWDRVVPLLRAADGVGQVIAVDLQAYPLQVLGKSLDQITTDDYVEGIVQLIADKQLHNIVLVGHSLAGITMPGVVHRLPDRIRHVIYISTSNPKPGQSVADLMAHPSSPMSREMSGKAMYCSDLDEETTHWLLSNLREEPLRPFSEPVTLCALPPGIPSTYVLLEKDQALLEDYQLEMAANIGVDEIRRFSSGHSAFAAKPRELAELLLEYR